MSNDLDLILFFSEKNEIREFQLCYDKNQYEQMLSWNARQGYSHMAIDDGESVEAVSYKQSPLIVPNGAYSLHRILDKLMETEGQLPKGLLAFVKEKIQQHPGFQSS
jgi:hypothetical protein